MRPHGAVIAQRGRDYLALRARKREGTVVLTHAEFFELAAAKVADEAADFLGAREEGA